MPAERIRKLPNSPAAPFSVPAGGQLISRAARRAAGVYYTPPELVRQVVELTLPGRWLKQAREAPLRVLDPACGAGEFLVGAAEWLRRRAPAELCGVEI